MDDYLMFDYYDGSKFSGYLLNKYEDSIWKLKIVTGDTIQVNRLLTKKVISEKSALIFNKRRYHLLKGVYFFSNLSIGTGDDLSYQLDLTAAITIGKRWSIGAGIGRSEHDYRDVTAVYRIHTFTNIYGYARYYFNQGRFRFFGDLKAGFALASNNFFDGNYSGGMYLQPGIGVTFASRKRFKWQIGISQYLLNSKGESRTINTVSPITQEFNRWFNRTTLNIGFVYTIPVRSFKK